MTSPRSIPSGKGPSECLDPSPVDLTPLNTLTPLDELSPSDAADPEVQTFYQQAAFFLATDARETGLGNGNGLLEMEEIERALARVKLDGGRLSACEVLEKARYALSLVKVPPVPSPPAKREETPDSAFLEEQARIELIFRYLKQTNELKFEQEKIDHSGEAGDSWLGWLVGHAAGWLGLWDHAESWNEHFQKTHPLEHKQARYDAIETLSATMRTKGFQKVEEALSHLEKDGDSITVRILLGDLDIMNWVRTAKAETALDRHKLLESFSQNYRRGRLKGFWDWQIVPAPRLGSGGWWERARQGRNWSWGKSPDLTMALSINNYLAMHIPNSYDLDQNGRNEILSLQLIPSDQKTFLEMVTKAEEEGETDWEAARTLLKGTSLTPEGQHSLLDRLSFAVQNGKNTKLLHEILGLPFVQSLPKDENETLMLLLARYVQGKIDLREMEDMFVTSFPQNYAEILIPYLHQLVIVPPPREDEGLKTLFREAQLGGLERRLQEIFDKETPTRAEEDEFKNLLQASKLSSENRQILQFLFDHREENRIARRAGDEFFDILGRPQKRMNPWPGENEWDPGSVGSLHGTIRVTAGRGTGLGIFLAPTAIPAGAAGTLSLGLNRILRVKGFNPWWATAAGGVVGALFSLTPEGQSFMKMGWDIMQQSYRPWSDLSVANLPSEGLGLYVSLGTGTQVGQGLIGGWRSPLFSWTKALPPSVLLLRRKAVYVGGVWGGTIGAVKVDPYWRPPTPLIPPFNESFGEAAPLPEGTLL